MKSELKPMQSRRQFFTSAFRYVVLAVLLAAGSAIIAKKRRLVQEGKCINRGICSDCEAFQRCSLPQALSAKEVLTRVDNGGK